MQNNTEQKANNSGNALVYISPEQQQCYIALLSEAIFYQSKSNLLCKHGVDLEQIIDADNIIVSVSKLMGFSESEVNSTTFQKVYDYLITVPNKKAAMQQAQRMFDVLLQIQLYLKVQTSLNIANQ